MDLDEKIGQLFVVPAHGDVVRHVRDNHVGGVIWFESTTRVTAEMNAHLQSIARTPLLISADLESGMGMRFTDATWWPPAMAIAATGDPSLAEELGRATAREALAIGVNHVLAPVADVNVDPQNPVINTRSFGEDPADVARFVAAYVRGTQSGGCLATAKHFPGHGDTHVDSHLSLPRLDVTRERLERVELVPFRAAIEAGVSSVMMGHLAVPALDDPDLPATLSKEIIGLLRQDLGFQGLVITDSFEMGALVAHFDPGEAAVRALEAGEDQILFSADTDAAIAAVRAAVASGRLSRARIEEAVGRVMHAKERVLGSSGSRVLGRVTAEEVAQRAITLLRDDDHLLPLSPSQLTAVIVTDLPEPNPLPEAVHELHPAHVVTVNAATDDVQIDGPLILLLALRPISGAGRIALPPAAEKLAQRHPIAISFGSPYVLHPFRTAVCAWGIQPVLQRAAIRAIRGEVPMSGKISVTL